MVIYRSLSVRGRDIGVVVCTGLNAMMYVSSFDVMVLRRVKVLEACIM